MEMEGNELENETQSIGQGPKLELFVRENAGKSRKEQGRFTVVCRTEKGIMLRRWVRGRKDALYFQSDWSRGAAFSGDRFSVRRPGPYTVYVEDADGNGTAETVLIRRNRLLVIVLPVMLVLAVGAGGLLQYLHTHHLPVPPIVRMIGGGHATPGPVSSETSSDILAKLKKEQAMVTDDVSSSAQFPSGKSGTTGSFAVENLSSNNVIMQASLSLNGKEIAKSPPIYPGEHIDGVTLSQAVPAGTFEAVATLSYYNPATKAYISKAGYKIHMTVAK